jgi:ribonuclease HI
MPTRRSAAPRAAPGPVPDGAAVVYTDGACSGNPGPGGWAWALAPDGAVWGSGAEPHTTNQQMEIQAALEAVRAFPTGPLVVVTDSTYVANCFRDRWYVNWRKNGWRNAKKEPVANRERWQPLIELYLAAPGRIEFRWVKGHSGDPLNDLVDRLAVEAATTQAAGGTPPAPAPAPAPGAEGPPTLF